MALRQSLHQLQAEENARNAASDKAIMQDRTTEWPTGRPKDPEMQCFDRDKLALSGKREWAVIKVLVAIDG